MKRNILSLLCLLFIACFTVQANPGPQNKTQREQWYKNMVQTKIEYIAKQMNLTPEQKAKFDKHYTAFSAETSKLSKETRALERAVSKKEKPTDIEYEKAAEAITEFKAKEGAIEQKYFNQFRTYLTKKQLFQLKVAEHKWMKELMNQRSKGKK